MVTVTALAKIIKIEMSCTVIHILGDGLWSSAPFVREPSATFSKTHQKGSSVSKEYCSNRELSWEN